MKYIRIKKSYIEFKVRTIIIALDIRKTKALPHHSYFYKNNQWRSIEGGGGMRKLSSPKRFCGGSKSIVEYILQIVVKTFFLSLQYDNGFYKLMGAKIPNYVTESSLLFLLSSDF